MWKYLVVYLENHGIRKIMKFRQLLSNINVTNSYELLEETGDLKTNYWDYMTIGGGYV